MISSGRALGGGEEGTQGAGMGLGVASRASLNAVASRGCTHLGEGTAGHRCRGKGDKNPNWGQGRGDGCLMLPPPGLPLMLRTNTPVLATPEPGPFPFAHAVPAALPVAHVAAPSLPQTSASRTVLSRAMD